MERNSAADTLIQQKLQALLDRLNRPIQSACENQGSSTTQLDSFVSAQIVEALRNTVFPARVEAELLVLRFLFQEQEGVRTDSGPIRNGQAGPRSSIHHGASAEFRFPNS